jgi:transposase InsO family protein
LFGQDTFYVGYIKGIGKIYQQTGIDTYSNTGFAKVYTEKTALTAADFINDKVLPFFDSHNLPLLRVLTDRGTEYCGIREQHPYQLFLYLNDIDHSRTKARHPQTNGCTERFNQTLLDEFYQVAFRKKIYTSLDEIQTDLDGFLHKYNTKRTNQGKHCKGRTPMDTFTDGLELCRTYIHDRKEDNLEAA